MRNLQSFLLASSAKSPRQLSARTRCVKRVGWPLSDMKPGFRRFGHQEPSSSLYQTLQPSGDCGSPVIRLLELLPGRGTQPVTARLRSLPLSSVPRYEAISYCWGDPTDTKTVICNGSPLPVPRRLEIALRNMRHPTQSRDLWADAICINQKDDKEKKVQVELMREIFASAERTLIWVGDKEERRQHRISIFALMSIKIGLLMLRRRLKALQSPEIPIFEFERKEKRVVAPFSSDFYLELIGLLRQPWFRRAWVVQEVAVSTHATIFWGGRQYEWDDIVRALKFMSEVDFPLAFIVTLEHVSAVEEERKYYRGGAVKLLSVLSRHQRCEATDLRDKVFSFLGLVKTPSIPRTQVNITYEEKTEPIYTQTARAMLDTDRNLDILSRPPSTTISELNLPSWVPDWSLPPASSLTYSWGHGPLSLTGVELSPSTPRFCASANTAFTPSSFPTNGSSSSSSTSNRSLIIQGYVLDTITETGPIYQGIQIPTQVRSFPSIVQEWWKCILSLLRARKVFIAWQKIAYFNTTPQSRNPTCKSTKETMREAFLNTVSTSEAGTSSSTPALDFELYAWEKSARIGIIGLPYSAWILISHFLSNKPFLVCEMQGRYSLRRRLVRTRGGYLGLASARVKSGDAVVLAAGGQVPLVLRRRLELEGNEQWELVGDAYVHSVMQGEAWEEKKCKSIILT
ncbi:hypothetical protein ACEPPN_010998 [Leptodophora sp. 'Broadleaf-Isolate-01']